MPLETAEFAVWREEQKSTVMIVFLLGLFLFSKHLPQQTQRGVLCFFGHFQKM